MPFQLLGSLRFSAAIPCLLPMIVCAAGTPVLNSVLPRGGQRGAEVVAEFTGARLDKALGVIFDEPGIELTKLEQVDASRAKCTLKIAPDAAIGLHRLQIRTAQGVSNVKVFSVGTLPEIKEIEPNSDRGKPQAVKLPITINGDIASEDVDYFSFEAGKGQTLAFEVEGMRLGDTLFDPRLAIFDAKGNELAVADDTTLVRQDCAVVVTFPADGTYVTEVRETAYGGNGDSHYRLHMGAFPRPLACLPAGGKVGTEVEVTWIGDPTASKQKVTLPTSLPGDYAILPERIVRTTSSQPAGIAAQPSSATTQPPARAASQPSTAPAPSGVAKATTVPVGVASAPAGIAHATTGPSATPEVATRLVAPSPVPFHVSPYASGLEIEPNNDHDHATQITVPGGVSGVISGERDIDCFVFDAKKGHVFEASVYARRLRSALDPVVELIRFKGAYVGGADDSVGPDSVYRFTIPEDGKYILQVRDHLLKHGPAFTYFLEVAPVAPKLTLSIPRGLTPAQAKVAVPAGNRAALLVTANRADFGGPLAFIAADLPPGVTLHADTMSDAVNQIPLVFEAAADAKPAGSMVDLIARHTDAKTGIEGHLLHAIDVIEVQANVVIYSIMVGRLAVGVTEAVPFKIDIVEPKVPIVRRGMMELPVKLERGKDFKAPVEVRLLWNPPGIGSGAITIPGDKTEGFVHLDANEGARVGKWKIAAIATADVGGGPFEISSQLATLEIADPYIDFTLAPVRTELGKPVDLVVKITHKTTMPAEARAELLGLPPKVATTQTAIAEKTDQVKYILQVPTSAPAGRHGGVFVRAVVMKDGQPIVHQSVGGELILDTPLPPKDPKAEAERFAAKKKAQEERDRKKAERLAVAAKRKAERDAARKRVERPATMPSTQASVG